METIITVYWGWDDGQENGSCYSMLGLYILRAWGLVFRVQKLAIGSGLRFQGHRGSGFEVSGGLTKYYKGSGFRKRLICSLRFQFCSG